MRRDNALLLDADRLFRGGPGEQDRHASSVKTVREDMGASAPVSHWIPRTSAIGRVAPRRIG